MKFESASQRWRHSGDSRQLQHKQTCYQSFLCRTTNVRAISSAFLETCLRARISVNTETFVTRMTSSLIHSKIPWRTQCESKSLNCLEIQAKHWEHYKRLSYGRICMFMQLATMIPSDVHVQYNNEVQRRLLFTRAFCILNIIRDQRLIIGTYSQYTCGITYVFYSV